jgi:hypothetical protein
LVGSADEVQAIAELLGDHFAARILRDADEATIGTKLRDCAGHFSQDAGGVVLMWSGHGIPGAGSTSVRLLARDSLNDPGGGIDAVEVATKVAATGANQILFIVDTCYAGYAWSCPWVALRRNCSSATGRWDGPGQALRFRWQ